MPKYTAKDLMGKHVVDRLKGTRLAAHLLEIRDRFGGENTRLHTLAKEALRGARLIDGQDIFVAIRDELHNTHANADHLSEKDRWQARELARGLNWHRVNDALDFDAFVKQFFHSRATNGLRETGRVMRAANKQFGKIDGEDNRGFDALKRYMNQQVGPNSGLGLKKAPTDDQLRASLERLARVEEYKEDLSNQGRKQLKEFRPSVVGEDAPTGPVDQIHTLNWLAGSGPAYRMNKGRAAVNANLDAEQYLSLEQALKYANVSDLLGEAALSPVTAARTVWDLAAGATKAITGKIKSVLSATPAAPKGPDGVAFLGTEGSGADATSLPSMEMQALKKNLHGKGIIDLNDRSKTEQNEATARQYADKMREILLGHLSGEVSNFGAGNYIRSLQDNASKGHSIGSLAEGMGYLLNAAHNWIKPAKPHASYEVVEPEHLLDSADLSDPHKPKEPSPQPEEESPQGEILWKPGLGEDAPAEPVSLKLVPKAKKSAAMLQKLKQLRQQREQRAFAVLHELQKRGIGEHRWSASLVGKEGIGLTAAQALSAIKKFHKLNQKQKKELEPLQFAARAIVERYLARK